MGFSFSQEKFPCQFIQCCYKPTIHPPVAVSKSVSSPFDVNQSLVAYDILFRPPTPHYVDMKLAVLLTAQAIKKQNSYKTNSKARCGLVFVLLYSSGCLKPKLKVSFPYIYGVLMLIIIHFANSQSRKNKIDICNS